MKKNIILFLMIFVASVVLVLFLVNEVSIYPFFGDDMVYSVVPYSEKPYDCLKFSYGHGGGYFGYFLSKFFSFWLPVKLNIHPNDFMSIHNIIKGIFTVITLLLISKFSNLYGKSRTSFTFAYIFLIFYYPYTVYNTHPAQMISISYAYYRYSFSIIFFSIFVYYICKQLLYKKEEQEKSNLLKNTLNIFIASISGYIAGTSSEIVIGSLLTFSALIYIYQLLIYVIYKIKNNKEFFENFGINVLNINIFIPILSLYIAAYCFTSSPGYQEVANSRHTTESVTFELITKFLYNYKELYITKISFFWLILVCLICAALYIAKRNKKINLIILPLILIFSVTAPVFALITCGNETFYIKDFFWLAHPNIQFVYKLLMVVPIVIIFGFITQYSNKIIKKIIQIIILALGIVYGIMLYKLYNSEEIQNTLKEYKHNKAIYYETEKIYRFYRLKNETPYLPIDMTHRYYPAPKFAQEEKCYPYNYHLFFYVYYPLTYQDYSYINPEDTYCTSEKAFEKFYNEGGIFSVEELEDINFQRLLDDDFVLNKK